MIDSDFDNLKFIHPSTIQVSGPTGCGKTRFVLNLLNERMIEPFPERLIWVYSEWQPDYDTLKENFSNMEFVRGFSEDLYDSILPKERNLLVLDDQMSEASDSKTLARLFTKGSHHRNLTVIYLVQNLYDQGKSSRTVSLNTHYIVIFKNKRDGSQFRKLAQQLKPNNSGWLIAAFENATKDRYGYLVIDNHPRARECLRFRTNIFNGECPAFYADYNDRETVSDLNSISSKQNLD